MLKQRRSRALMLGAALLWVFSSRVGMATEAPLHRPVTTSQIVDLLIYNKSGTKLIGKAHYTMMENAESAYIEGRNTFIDGEYDIEHESLRVPAPGALPELVSYEHLYFGAHDKPRIVARADTATGAVTCGKYGHGRSVIQNDMMHFARNTYAGASILFPIEDRLKSGETAGFDIKVFDCASGPRIVTLHVDFQRAVWRYRPGDGEMIKADATPVFGWLDIFLKPFVPTTEMWLDPDRDFAFMGGILSRYYRGPEVLLVSAAPPLPPTSAIKRPAAATIERRPEPALTAPDSSAAATKAR